MSANPHPYLDPLSQALADSSPPQELETIPIDEYRANFRKSQQHETLPGVDRAKTTVDGLETWIYKPEGVDHEKLLPYVFFIHGGGWVAGDMYDYDSLISDLCLRTGFAVVFPVYTLAPDAKFPLQHEQCYGALKWLTQNGEAKGLQEKNFAVAGDSAGGHLAAGINIMAIERKEYTIPYTVLISPLTSSDLEAPETRSEFAFFEGPYLTVPFQRRVIRLYMPRKEDRDSILGTPLDMPESIAKQFSPTLIIVSSGDMLRSQGYLFGQKLQQQGIDCAVIQGDGQLHDTVLAEATRNGPTPKVLMGLISGEIKARLARED